MLQAFATVFNSKNQKFSGDSKNQLSKNLMKATEMRFSLSINPFERGNNEKVP